MQQTSSTTPTALPHRLCSDAYESVAAPDIVLITAVFELFSFHTLLDLQYLTPADESSEAGRMGCGCNTAISHWLNAVVFARACDSVMKSAVSESSPHSFCLFSPPFTSSLRAPPPKLRRLNNSPAIPLSPQVPQIPLPHVHIPDPPFQ